ncbi:ornithine cyclodeaminase [Steroidobacter sp.]|uniref:ornithine cyclodeaminase n=1 Tax=Steroidobacter sp. TaxID=1978227 RepID=UPI001A578BBD|nr:ornithine cyclodeaminase [Steroidobacter sp.]MBL8267687.1 ornithine cyclodeaminase [Steroidobacter sp.]
MVDYVGIADIQHLIEEIGAGEFMERLAGQIESDYKRWGEFEKSPRLASHSDVGVIELMPISDGGLYSFKYVNGHPKNTGEGLLTVTAFGVLAAVDTGYPLLLSELTITTALRTSAMSALAAKWMARPDSKVMALIGNGAQSEFQAIAFQRILGITELRLFDVDPKATAKIVQNLRAMPEMRNVTLVRATSCEEAVRGADIVTTVTADKRNAVILTPDMIQPGMHLNAVGGDCPGKTELHVDILHRPDVRIVVEYEPQSRIEGEIQQLAAAHPVIEFAEVVRGAAQGRAAAGEVTLFDSVGFALEDYSALRFLHDLIAERPEFCRQIDLVPEIDDPKDLYGGTLGSGKRRAKLRRAA